MYILSKKYLTPKNKPIYDKSGRIIKTQSEKSSKTTIHTFFKYSHSLGKRGLHGPLHFQSIVKIDSIFGFYMCEID